jgi:two-component system LytT family response regulator
MISCIIVDDQIENVEVIEEHLKQIPQLSLLKKFTNSVEALEFLESNHVGLAFLDIQMPGLSGLKLIENLKAKKGTNIPKFIMTTGYPEYALSGFEYGVVDFIVKPIFFKRFKVAVDKVLENWKDNKALDYFFVEAEGAKLKFNYEDIVYVESKGNYIHFKEKGKKTNRTIYRPMYYIQELLPEPHFIRIHNSFIVSMKFVVSAKVNEIVLNVEGEDKIFPVGGKFKDNVSRHCSSKPLYNQL